MNRRNWFKIAVGAIAGLVLPSKQAKAFTYGGGKIFGYTAYPVRCLPTDWFYSWSFKNSAGDLLPITNDPDPRLVNGLPYGGRDIQIITLNGEIWREDKGEPNEGMFCTFIRIGEAGCIRGIVHRWDEYQIPMQIIIPGKPHKAGGWVPVLEVIDTHTPGVIPGRVLSEEEAEQWYANRRGNVRKYLLSDADGRYIERFKKFCVTGKVTYTITEKGYEQLAIKKKLEESGYYQKGCPTELKAITESVTIG